MTNDFGISISQIFAGLLFGTIGLYLLRLSKKNSHFPHMLLGIALMAYTYFVSSDVLAWVIGIALTVLAWFV